MKEEWKDIEGYENYYIISNTGKIKSLLTNKLLALSDVNNMGYKRVTLYKPVKKRFLSIDWLHIIFVKVIQKI